MLLFTDSINLNLNLNICGKNNYRNICFTLACQNKLFYNVHALYEAKKNNEGNPIESEPFKLDENKHCVFVLLYFHQLNF